MKKAWVLSGGGAQIVQMLVLIERYLERGGKMPDFIVGTSAGGLMPMLIAFLGVTGARKKILSITKRQDLFAGQMVWGVRELGLWSPAPLQRLIKDLVSRKKSMPFYVCSYDIMRHKKVYLEHKDGWFHLASTACIPILVNPVDTLVDGGIVENKPLQKAIDLGATEIQLFSCSAEFEPEAKMPANKIALALRCVNALALETARDDVKVCVKTNAIPGKARVTVTHHVPTRNVTDVLDFGKLKEGYELSRMYNK